MRLGILLCAAFAAGLLSAGDAARALTVDFDDLAHGEVVESTRYAGVSITVENEMQPFDIAVGFNTNATLSADPDLHGPDWSGGNLAPTTDLGRVLIIQSNSFGCADDICDVPDDQAGVPAGMLTFDFDEPITRFGFDLVDLEGPFAPQTSISFFSGNVLIGRIYFDDFTDVDSPWYDPTVEYGDNTANRFRPILLQDLGAASADRVELRLAESGAVDNIRATLVPEPATALQLAAGLLGLAMAGRRRRA